ncbi:hypothetical protein [Niabella drilacis]|uniref:hypothetical protein n=1 Tax=Niabella drilacis (strain DSM 25811 / CCM 8410 / CCUG 62505 / LMG 26954 / E90) TaxID=1285928 RepID=UPI000B808F2B|nr:hypothetical protein [Niabella drilacis]
MFPILCSGAVRRTAKDKIKWNGGDDADNGWQKKCRRQAVINRPATRILSVPPNVSTIPYPIIVGGIRLVADLTFCSTFVSKTKVEMNVKAVMIAKQHTLNKDILHIYGMFKTIDFIYGL